jgi:RNA polymerase primary sigma factor
LTRTGCEVVANLSAKGWKDFAKSESTNIRDLRAEIQ